jgi:hypothetical protein
MPKGNITVYANKRLFHGGLRQRFKHLICKLKRGHEWTEWKWYDEGLRGRRCLRQCGAHNLINFTTPFAVSHNDIIEWEKK